MRKIFGADRFCVFCCQWQCATTASNIYNYFLPRKMMCLFEYAEWISVKTEFSIQISNNNCQQSIHCEEKMYIHVMTYIRIKLLCEHDANNETESKANLLKNFMYVAWYIYLSELCSLFVNIDTIDIENNFLFPF